MPKSSTWLEGFSVILGLTAIGLFCTSGLSSHFVEKGNHHAGLTDLRAEGLEENDETKSITAFFTATYVLVILNLIVYIPSYYGLMGSVRHNVQFYFLLASMVFGGVYTALLLTYINKLEFETSSGTVVKVEDTVFGSGFWWTIFALVAIVFEIAFYGKARQVLEDEKHSSDPDVKSRSANAIAIPGGNLPNSGIPGWLRNVFVTRASPKPIP